MASWLSAPGLRGRPCRPVSSKNATERFPRRCSPYASPSYLRPSEAPSVEWGERPHASTRGTEPRMESASLRPTRMEAHPLAPRTLHQLSLFSAHLSAAARLRQATALQGGGDVSEAVLDPVGKVLHAAGPARAPEARRTLADAVRRMDRARGALRRTEPDEALQLWQGLVDGAWSLVEQCEADGKRYVLAHRNAPGVRDPKALTPHERFVVAFAAMGHQNKFIGYELGLSASGVAEHLSSAARKLRVSSRAELVRLLAPLIREQRRTEQSP